MTSVPLFCQKCIAWVSFAASYFPSYVLARPWPYRLAPAAGESCGAHICPIPCSLCHLMYNHTLIVLQQMPQHSQHQSTARILVPSGPFGLAEQGLLFEHFFLFQNFESGWECLESINTRFWPISSNFLCGYHKILFHSKRSKPPPRGS